MSKHVHFIGIAGHAMAPLAKMFKDMAWEITGSDQKAVFPPVTTYLKDNKIDFNRGYSAANLTGKPDLVVVGRSALLVDKENPEVNRARELGCQIFSYPEILRNFLIKKNSIVVVGTYGKTTSTALVAWILEQAGFSPSFMIGGLPLNFPDGVRNTASSYSVVEGDEVPAARETDPPKFMFYKPKYVLLTAAVWDHPEVFKAEEDYLDAFAKFLKLIPKNGLLVICKDGKNTEKLVKFARCRRVWYSSKSSEADFWIENVSFLPEYTNFEVVSGAERILLKTSLLGEHNLQNICGCVALCRQLGIEPEVIGESVKTFQGIQERLEYLGTYGQVVLYRDFAQHPIKVRESLAALRTRYKDRKIICVFDPHSRLLGQRRSLEWYLGNFDLADKIVITKVTFTADKPKEEWVKGADIVREIAKTQKEVFYEPLQEKVVGYLTRESKPGDIIIFMSSGGLRTTETIEKTIDGLKRK